MEAAIAIKAGRHPLLDNVHAPINSGVGASGGYVANDVYLNTLSNTLLVSGPNNSGKSTYMKQIALLVLLAHTGSYVPAAAAEVRVIKHLYICAQEDNTLRVMAGLQSSTSAFYTEMKRIASVLNQYAPDAPTSGHGQSRGHNSGPGNGDVDDDDDEHSGYPLHRGRIDMRKQENPDLIDSDSDGGNDASHALILLDELGRSTSSEDGACVAWAVLERLAAAQCLCVCVTHLVQLADMPRVYPNVRNVSLEVDCQRAPGSSGLDGVNPGQVPEPAGSNVPILRFPFRVRTGVGSAYAQSYGIAVAAAVGLPVVLVRDAEEVARALRAGSRTIYGNGDGSNGNASRSDVEVRAAAMHTLLGRVLSLRNSEVKDLKYVRKVIMELVKAFAEDVANANM